MAHCFKRLNIQLFIGRFFIAARLLCFDHNARCEFCYSFFTEKKPGATNSQRNIPEYAIHLFTPGGSGPFSSVTKFERAEFIFGHQLYTLCFVLLISTQYYDDKYRKDSDF